MKIVTIANDSWERALLKSKRGGEIFLNPAQNSNKEILIKHLTECRDAAPEETFLILCNDFDTATFLTLNKILEMLNLRTNSLILFGITESEVNTIHRLQRKKNLGFLRAVYSKSYWNIIGRLKLEN